MQQWIELAINKRELFYIPRALQYTTFNLQFILTCSFFLDFAPPQEPFDVAPVDRGALPALILPHDADVERQPDRGADRRLQLEFAHGTGAADAGQQPCHRAARGAEEAVRLSAIRHQLVS